MCIGADATSLRLHMACCGSMHIKISLGPRDCIEIGSSRQCRVVDSKFENWRSLLGDGSVCLLLMSITDCRNCRYEAKPPEPLQQDYRSYSHRQLRRIVCNRSVTGMSYSRTFPLHTFRNCSITQYPIVPVIVRDIFVKATASSARTITKKSCCCLYTLLAHGQDLSTT